MNPDHTQLWQKIKDFEFDDPGSSFTFSDRLARENGWPLEYALRAAEEYKKFMFLAYVCDHPVMPSDQVDQVWHLHLLYTHSYWKEFCGEILKQEIHHGPAKGGDSERTKFQDWYAKTLARYRIEFTMDPPEDIWPVSSVRFNDIDFQRINRRTHWVIKKPFA